MPPRSQIAALGLLALLTLVPVTLPVPVLRELVLERFSVSELATSTFMSINMIGAVITAPLAGIISDRFGRRRPIVTAALVIDALCFLLLTLPLNFGVFMAIRFVEGCAHIFAISLVLADASERASSNNRGRVMGVVGAGLLLGVALGAPLGGILGRWGPTFVLEVGATILLATAVYSALVVGGQPTRPSDKPRWSEIVAMVRARPLVFVPLLFAFTDRFTVGFFTTTFSLYLKRIHELSPAQVGGLIAAFMLPFALLTYPFGKLSEKTSPVVLMGAGSLCYGVATATLGWWPPQWLVILMLVLGVMAAVMFVPSLLLTVESTDPRARATALGAFNAAGSLGFIVGPVVGGGVSQWVAAEYGWNAGYRAAFGVAGVCELLCVLAALPFLAQVARARTEHRRQTLAARSPRAPVASAMASQD